MDSQFKTLTSSYHDNYLQYKITGNTSYRNSYMSAEDGIKKILNSLEDQVSSDNTNITTFYNSDIEGKLRDAKSQIRLTEKNLVKNKDKEIAASIRNSSVSSSSPQIPTNYLISIGVLTAGVVLLSVLK